MRRISRARITEPDQQPRRHGKGSGLVGRFRLLRGGGVGAGQFGVQRRLARRGRDRQNEVVGLAREDRAGGQVEVCLLYTSRCV